MGAQGSRRSSAPAHPSTHPHVRRARVWADTRLAQAPPPPLPHLPARRWLTWGSGTSPMTPCQPRCGCVAFPHAACPCRGVARGTHRPQPPALSSCPGGSPISGHLLPSPTSPDLTPEVTMVPVSTSRDSGVGADTASQCGLGPSPPPPALGSPWKPHGARRSRHPDCSLVTEPRTKGPASWGPLTREAARLQNALL